MENIYHGKPIEKTDHPHIVKVRGVGSGEPIIYGTRIMVRTIVEHYQLGSSIEEILWDFQQLKIYLNENLSWKVAKALRGR